jgi:outer membrane lipoprotein-sorting protein
LAPALLPARSPTPVPAPAPPAPPGAKREAPLRFLPGDVLQSLLEASDRRAWTTAQVDKTEMNLGGKAPSPSSRSLMTASGSRARLEIQTPAAGLIVADGKYLWVELPQVDQVYRYDQAQMAASGNFFLDLASSIRHYAKGSVKRRFRPGDGYDENRVSAFELVPLRREPGGFERMRVWVDTRRWVVLRVQLDSGGTRSDIVFSRIQVMSWRGLRADPGQALPKGIFKYTKPKAFEVFKIDL